MLVWSRCVTFEVDGRDQPVLVPLIDMPNHQNGEENAEIKNVAGKGFQISALKEISRGSEIRISYGPLCNSILFLQYGFVMADNCD